MDEDDEASRAEPRHWLYDLGLMLTSVFILYVVFSLLLIVYASLT